MTPVPAPSDRRFRRAHVKPTRRRRWYAVLKPVAMYGILAILVITGVYWGGSTIMDAHVLPIERIQVSGNRRLASNDVVALVSGMRGQNIVLTDLSAWRGRLLESPWVHDATLRRTLPGTIEITIAERDPVLIARLGDGLYLIDRRGLVIDEYGPSYQDFDLPIVDGLSEKAVAPGEAIDGERAGLAARLIASLAAKPDVAARLSQIDVRDAHNAAIVLTGDSALIYVGEDRFLPRVESYLQLQATLRDRVPDIDYVDLRFDERIYVRPSKSSGSVAIPVGNEKAVGVTGRVNERPRR